MEEIVGAENVRRGEAAGSFAVNGLVPELTVLPGTRDEAARVIVAAAERGWGLVAYGGGTQIDLGLPPRRFDLALSTARLNRLVDYQPDDMTVTVEPGMTLAALEAVLAERGQFLPLDPPLAERATVGGVVAAAASGPWRAGYGTPRDWVIGCRVIGADGEEVRGGGQVVKNVAGYDLPKLYTGSFGTLGLITEVTFKVMPRPESSGFALMGLSSTADAEALTGRILHSDLLPAAVVLRHEEEGGGQSWTLIVQFMHAAEAVEWQLARLAELAVESGTALETPDSDAAQILLQECRDLPAAPLSLQARLGSVSSAAAELAGRAVELCGKHGTPAAVQAYPATGQILVACPEPVNEAFTVELRALAEAAGGTCLFTRLPAPLTGKIDPWGPVGTELRLMRGIKAALDPQGLFSPGRFVAGL